MDEDQGSATITNGSAVSYEIPGLQKNSMYSMTVTASNAAGSAPVSNTVTAMTGETGVYIHTWVNVTCFNPTVPSAPPSSVMVTDVTSTTMTVQWGPVEPCADQNGVITGYSVRYGSETMSLLGDSSGGMTTITGLSPSTTYSTQVAAETSAGTGVYSSAVDKLTNGVYE